MLIIASIQQKVTFANMWLTSLLLLLKTSLLLLLKHVLMVHVYQTIFFLVRIVTQACVCYAVVYFLMSLLK